MKYLILIPDGCGDWPIESLGGKTPLEAAGIRHMNGLAAKSEVGTVKTIPDGFEPGSDVANLSILGFDPAIYLTGRASLEAVGAGVEMKADEVAFRVNLITVEGNGAYDDLLIKDHSAGDISNEEAEVLIQHLHRELGGENMRFYPGVSYRHLLITSRLSPRVKLTPPHDVLNQPLCRHLPREGEDADKMTDMLRRGYALLNEHPINVKRRENGQNPANSIWFWGQGSKPALTDFEEKYGVKGSIISAVNLVKGIGHCAGLSVLTVPGATGTLHTNYAGKAEYAINEFKNGVDFVYVHVEAPDECSHSGDLEGKLESLRRIDEGIAKPVLDYLKNQGEPYRVLILPDHMTPVSTRTHTAEPVPFVLFDSEDVKPEGEEKAFSEAMGKKGMFFNSGYELADYFFRNNK
jgi:2,3-bisphosphoglycerate-independent phosphoglycerate mutase